MTDGANTDDLIGTQIGNLRIFALIGRGGMGAVYLAEHEWLKRKAAVKVLLPELSGRTDLLHRFLLEARETARLRHSSFVEIFDSGKLPSGRAYLAMEYLVGESLGSLLCRKPDTRLPWDLALTVARHIATGMSVAHQQQIIHRDLKPDNIFLNISDVAEHGTVVKILDFGIAKLTALGGDNPATRTCTGALVGTPLYMSPEQCRGRGAVDHRSDIYSLGCILYATLAGYPPFAFDGPGEIISAHLTVTPPSLRLTGVEVPAAVESFVFDLLAKDPGARPSSMERVAANIGALLLACGGKDVSLAELGVQPTDHGAWAASANTVPGRRIPHVGETRHLTASNQSSGTLNAVASETVPPPRLRERLRFAKQGPWAGLALAMAIPFIMYRATILPAPTPPAEGTRPNTEAGQVDRAVISTPWTSVLELARIELPAERDTARHPEPVPIPVRGKSAIAAAPEDAEKAAMSEVDVLMNRARDSWAQNDCRKAVALVRKINEKRSVPEALKILATCSCTLHHVALAKQAYFSLSDTGDRSLIEAHCAKYGIAMGVGDEQ
ncbi:MAG TPA: serine/threonine-protein kinase [Polyangia bacterium]|jgi:serine/threonine protein kinase|nr:serine/threonine-protein kinase [Polyangia bacterium]